MNRLRVGWTLLCAGSALLLGACGGGGGETDITVSIQSSRLEVQALDTDAEAPAVSTRLVLSGAPKGDVYVGAEFSSRGIDSVAVVEIDELHAELQVRLRHPENMQPGDYDDTVTVHVCHDDQCRKPVRGSPLQVAVRYQVRQHPATLVRFDLERISVRAGPNDQAPVVSALATLSGPDAATVFLRVRKRGRGIASFDSVRISATQFRIDLRFVDPRELAFGVHDGEILAQACYDEACTRETGGAGVSTSYVVDLYDQQLSARVPGQVRDAVWDPVSQKFYLSFVSIEQRQIGVLDPRTGAVSVLEQDDAPGKLAVSDDGAYLYVGAAEMNKVRRYRLPGMTLDTTLDLGLNRHNGMLRRPTIIEVAPGAPRTLAVEFFGEGIAVFDDDRMRPTVFEEGGGKLAWGEDASRLYVQGNGGGLSVLNVDAEGAKLDRQNREAHMGYLNQLIHYADGRIFTERGAVFDVDTGLQLGAFRAPGGADSTGLLPDLGHGRVYMLSNDNRDGSRQLTRFDSEGYTALKTVGVMLDAASVVRRIVRWGEGNLAILTDHNGLYLLEGAAEPDAAPSPP